MTIEPYYSDEWVTLYHARCEDVLPSVSDVGLVITSPPYNLSMGLDDVPVEAMHDRRSKSRSGAAANRMTVGYNLHDDAMPQAEYVAWQHRILRACWATLTDSGAIFYNHKPRSQAGLYRTPLAMIPDDLPVRQVIVWDRVEKAQSYTEQAFVSGCEWVVVVAKPGFRLRSRAASAASDVWRVHPERGGGGHPCPFPVGIPSRILDAARCTGAVLDPFAGSGTTLVAAKAARLHGIGVEFDERYCEIAAKRLSQGVLDFGGAA